VAVCSSETMRAMPQRVGSVAPWARVPLPRRAVRVAQQFARTARAARGARAEGEVGSCAASSVLQPGRKEQQSASELEERGSGVAARRLYAQMARRCPPRRG